MKNQLDASLAPLRNFLKAKKNKMAAIINKKFYFTHIFASDVLRDTILVSKSRFLGSKNLFMMSTLLTVMGVTSVL